MFQSEKNDKIIENIQKNDKKMTEKYPRPRGFLAGVFFAQKNDKKMTKKSKYS